MDSKYFIETLNLLAHPEGGYYKETYRSSGTVSTATGNRNYSTAIYFLLEEGNFSALHKIKSDELWHFYTGDALEIIEITKTGNLKITELSEKNFQYCVPSGNWFGSRVEKGGKFSLVGCTVAPGFDFADFEMAKKDLLLKEFPQHSEIITELTR